MKSHTIKLKQDNMLCHKCVLNVVKTLSKLPGIEVLNVNLDTKRIEIKFSGNSIPKDMVEDIIEQSIINGKVDKFPTVH